MAKIEKTPAKRGKAHIRYKLANGKVVPGVTTVLGIINKPMLVKWANNLGLKGIDSSTYVDATARIGTLAHEMIQEYLGGPQWDRTAFSHDEVDGAENAILSFYEWEKQTGYKMQTEKIEMPMVSEIFGYGGTIDWYGDIGGKKWLVDLKTSKALYPEHEFQVAAYRRLLIENGFTVDGVRLIRVGRSEDEGFDDHVLGDEQLDFGWQVFTAAMILYKTKQQYEKRDWDAISSMKEAV